MQEFLDIVLAFPTIVFTVLMGISVIFWLMVVVGGVGGELLSVDLDLDLDVDVDGGGFELLSVLGIGKVPLTIWAGVFVFWGWIISFFTVYHLQDVVAINFLIGSAILALTTVISIPLSGAVVFPIRLLFEGDSGSQTGDALVGTEVSISTNRVDQGFGRARCIVDGAEIVVSVRCHIDNDLSRGDAAYIIDYNDADNTYRVKSHDAFFGAADTTFGTDDARDDKRFDFNTEEEHEEVEIDEEVEQKTVSQTP